MSCETTVRVEIKPDTIGAPGSGRHTGYAKGKNGYFNLDHVTVESPQHHAKGSVWVHLFSGRSAYPGPAYMVISVEEARELANAILKVANE